MTEYGDRLEEMVAEANTKLIAAEAEMMSLREKFNARSEEDNMGAEAAEAWREWSEMPALDKVMAVFSKVAFE